MKYSKTALMELTHQYRSILRKCAILNAAILMGAMIAATPAKADGGITISEDTTYSNENVADLEFLQEDVTSRDINQGFGGYAFVDRPATLTVKDSNYENLTFDGSGAVFGTRIPSGGVTAGLIVEGTDFLSNHTKFDGGAIGNYNVLTVTDSNFSGNTAFLSKDNDGNYTVVSTSDTPIGGGAIALGSDSHVVIEDSLFDGNVSGFDGGAIGTRHSSDGNQVNAEMEISDSEFTANEAVGKGGAIYNSFHKKATISGSNFSTNSATDGGAIFNAAGGTKDPQGGDLKISDTAFIGNSATASGGAIYNNGTLTIEGGADGRFSNNTAAKNGGAIYSESTDAITTVNGATFTGNKATGTNSIGGAMYVYSGTANITGTTFEENQADYGGAVYTKARVNRVLNTSDLTITDSEFKNNTARGVGAVGVMRKGVISGTDFIGNKATDSTNDGAGAVFLGSESYTTITGGTFNNNTSAAAAGAIGTRDFGQGNNTAAKLDISGTTFQNNVAATTGGAIDNYFYNDANGDGYVKVTGAAFTNNSAANGGAVYNHKNATQTGKMYIADSNFTTNTASTAGGAIYNEGEVTIAAVNKDVSFKGNTANSVANDIYNTGTLNLNAADGKTISLEGGIDGSAGTVNIAGDVEVSILKNQTVAHNSGELYLKKGALDGSNLAGSTVAVNSGATINTMDGAINNYTGKVTLNAGANVKAEANATAIDAFTGVSGKTVNLTGLNVLEDFTGSKLLQLATAGNIAVADTVKTYTSTTKYTVTGSTDDSGNITVAAAGTGGLKAAADDTAIGTREVVTYTATADDTSGSSGAVDFQNADVSVKGQGTESTDATITLNNGMMLDGLSTMSIEDAKFAGTGTFETEKGSYTSIKNSRFDMKIVNKGTMDSDPTYYGAEVVNEGTYTFDADIFESGSSLTNSATVNLKNGVEFKAGSTLTGNTGNVLNLVSGTTIFNGSSSGNNVFVAEGAKFSGTLSGGSVDTRNNSIDTGLGTVNSGANLYVDASLKGTGSVDAFASTTGSTIKTINLVNSEYGTADKITLDVGGASLDSDLQITGAMNYYTDIKVEDGKLVFSDKLVNTSTIRGTGDGSSTFVGDVVIGDKADTTTIGTPNVQIALDNGNTQIDITAGTSTDGSIIGLDEGSVNLEAANSTSGSTAKVSADATNNKAVIEATNGSNTASVVATATSSGAEVDVTGNLVAKSGLTVGTTNYGIDSTGAADFLSLKLGSGSAVSAIDTDGSTATANEATTLATVATVTDRINDAAGNGLASSAGVLSLALTDKGGLQLDGTSPNKTLSVLTDETTLTKDATTGALKIANGGVDTAQLADGAVTANKIADGSITVAKMNADAITTSSELSALLADPTTASDSKLMTEKAVVTGISTIMAQKETWAQGLLGVNTTLGTDNQLQTALTGLGGTNNIASTTIAGALHELDAEKAGLSLDNTFTGANTFKSDSGLTIQKGDGSASVVMTASLATDSDSSTHNVLGVNGRGLFTEELASQKGLVVVNGSGDELFAATANGIEVGDGTNTTFTVTAATGAVTAGDLAATGITTVGGSTKTVDIGGAGYTNTITGTKTAVSGITQLDATATTGGLQFGASGQNVNAIDNDGTKVASTVAATTRKAALATAETVYLGAESAKFTTTVAAADTNISGTTIKTAINDLDVKIGSDTDYTSAGVNGVAVANSIKANIDAVNVALGNVSAQAINGSTATDLTTAVNDLNSNMHTVLGGLYSSSTTGTYAAYDASALTADMYKTAGTTPAAGTNLAGSLNNLAANITNITGGSMNSGVVENDYATGVSGINYSALADNSATPLATAIGQINKNIGVASDAANGNITATKTVNANLDALDAAIGDRSTLSATNNNLTTNGSVVANLTTIDTRLGDIKSLDGTDGTGPTGNLAAANKSVADHLNAIDTRMGQIDGLYDGTTVHSSVVTSTVNGNSNLANGSTVEDHLVSLDNSVGDRTQFASARYISTGASVADAAMALDANLNRVEHDLNQTKREMKGGFAAAAAMAALVPNARAAGDTQISVGTGTYRGRAGMALGGFHYINDNVLVNVGASYAGSNSTTFKAGVTFGW